MPRGEKADDRRDRHPQSADARLAARDGRVERDAVVFRHGRIITGSIRPANGAGTKEVAGLEDRQAVKGPAEQAGEVAAVEGQQHVRPRQRGEQDRPVLRRPEDGRAVERQDVGGCLIDPVPLRRLDVGDGGHHLVEVLTPRVRHFAAQGLGRRDGGGRRVGRVENELARPTRLWRGPPALNALGRRREARSSRRSCSASQGSEELAGRHGSCAIGGDAGEVADVVGHDVGHDVLGARRERQF